MSGMSTCVDSTFVSHTCNTSLSITFPCASRRLLHPIDFEDFRLAFADNLPENGDTVVLESTYGGEE